MGKLVRDAIRERHETEQTGEIMQLRQSLRPLDL